MLNLNHFGTGIITGNSSFFRVFLPYIQIHPKLLNLDDLILNCRLSCGRVSGVL